MRAERSRTSATTSRPPPTSRVTTWATSSSGPTVAPVTRGEAAGDELSRNSIGGRGDDDGDGIDDWMVGTQTSSAKAYYAGAAYLVLGDPSAKGETSAADVAAQIYGESDSEYAGRSFD